MKFLRIALAMLALLSLTSQTAQGQYVFVSVNIECLGKRVGSPGCELPKQSRNQIAVAIPPGQVFPDPLPLARPARQQPVVQQPRVIFVPQASGGAAAALQGQSTLAYGRIAARVDIPTQAQPTVTYSQPVSQRVIRVTPQKETPTEQRPQKGQNAASHSVQRQIVQTEEKDLLVSTPEGKSVRVSCEMGLNEVMFWALFTSKRAGIHSGAQCVRQALQQQTGRSFDYLMSDAEFKPLCDAHKAAIFRVCYNMKDSPLR